MYMAELKVLLYKKLERERDIFITIKIYASYNLFFNLLDSIFNTCVYTSILNIFISARSVFAKYFLLYSTYVPVRFINKTFLIIIMSAYYKVM